MGRNRTINVLVLESVFYDGGAEKITYDIVRRMNRSRFHFTFCTLYHPGPWGEILIRDGYKLYHDIIKSKFDPTALFKLRRIIRENEVDIIYFINQPLTIFWAFTLGKICRIPTIAVVHNTFVTKESLRLIIYRILLPQSHKIIAVSKMQKQHMVANERIPEHLITVIYNGINTKEFGLQTDREQKRRSLNLPESSKTVGVVARLVYIKGIDIYLKAASLLKKEEKDVIFLIVGDGPEIEGLKCLAQELGLGNAVNFLGKRDDVSQVLPIFDVAVLPSRTEALPLAILEYMAAGIPIVATRVGSVPELVVDGFTGFLIEPENPHALAEKISYLLNNEVIAKTMGDNAREMVNHRYSIEATVAKTEELIEEVIRGKERLG